MPIPIPSRARRSARSASISGCRSNAAAAIPTVATERRSTDSLRPLISERRLRRRVRELARRIDHDYPDKPLTLIVVLKGAAIFAADLMRELTVPFALEFVGASSYRNNMRSSGEVALGNTDAIGIAGRDVLVVEDILDTGLTSTALLDRLRRRGPASLALCALLDKRNGRAAGLPVAYAGFTIPDEFVVGYGMDYAERYRNLRGVYLLRFEPAEP
ncbi:MAG TPA: hypoxanthine phosphoribosyltransferase [Stellaceae bacterium]|jgi:hypoxanthine phosphoribosyltransferase|nr:hypoxanthine phosphoribosyltransferase [Stellaceae bacterium]